MKDRAENCFHELILQKDVRKLADAYMQAMESLDYLMGFPSALKAHERANELLRSYHKED
jgi:hypothetical protein